MAWNTSDRASRLPPDWQAIRAKVRRRARGKCEAEQHAPGCDGRGTQADHIIPGDDHSLENLQWLSEPCHRAKTARETADRNRAYAAMRRRPEEPHPGATRSNRRSSAEPGRPARVGGDSPAKPPPTAG